MTPWRSREYLDLAAGQACVKCGGFPCVSAHYSGLMAHKVGKGGSQKAADIVSAHLCDKCHKEFDLYADGNDDARAVDFLLLCWQTLLRNMEHGTTATYTHAGQLTVSVAAPFDRAKPWRARKSKCTASEKQVPRTASCGESLPSAPDNSAAVATADALMRVFGYKRVQPAAKKRKPYVRPTKRVARDGYSR